MITIAIDGFSSTGKSTLAKQIATIKGYVYVDTGAMYRAVTLFAMNECTNEEGQIDIEQLDHKMNQVILDFKFNHELGYAEMYLNGKNVEKEIRTLEVSQNVSKIAELSFVRTRLVELQKAMRLRVQTGIIMDGRDIGTSVFPDADLKFFMTATPEIRAERRYLEMQSKGENASFEEVLQNVVERDYIDSNREISPLRKADDAIEIDNSKLTLDDQLALILQKIDSNIKHQS